MKQFQSGGSLISSEVNTLFSLLRTRKTKVFFYGFVSAFVAGTVFLAFNSSGTSLASSQPWFNNIFSAASHICDIFQGSWVKDDSYPLYREGSCPHIDEPFDCFRNGRPDLNYQKLRWQPDDCDIPRLVGDNLKMMHLFVFRLE
ncbi:hypothetical protein QJS04_geneDACA020876 [Acorus gramineus]|uniref:Trichome birefringence-like N-terminal domain-containing protein n=1 Tax=Acorus gramineus TaxID=55184 RepID=A0AAV9BPB1_ACOGR|nr:hypothetical protein QJS04_geneDACA020876 [Acorus gramineus]